jgi:hypothetical protein
MAKLPPRVLEDLRDLHWMARRYADGRQSYATGLFNGITRRLIKLGVKLNPTSHETFWARDAMGRPFDRLSDEEASMGQQLTEFDIWRDEEVKWMREAFRGLLEDMRSASHIAQDRRLKNFCREAVERAEQALVGGA